MSTTEKDLQKAQELIEEALGLIDKSVPRPRQLKESNALDTQIQSLIILQKMLLTRFGKNEKLLLPAVKEIVQIMINYYNASHAKNLGFLVRLKSRFFR